MLSNLVNQLREMDALDKIDEVYKELPRVRKDLGQIPLVTPTSQIVGIQTVNNVLFDTPDERYKMITGQVKDLCYGLYGKTAVPINPEVQKKALKGYDRGEEPITCRPAEVLAPELEKAKEEIGDLAVDMDDLVLYAIYPVTGKKFLQWKYGKEEAPAEVRPTSLEEAKAREDLVRMARKGEVVPKAKLAEQPEKSENTRKFNVFIEDDVIEVAVDEVGGSPVLNYLQAGGAIAAAPAAPVAPAAAAPAGPVPAAPKPAAPAAPAPATPAEAPKAAAPAPAAAADTDGTPLNAPMPGMIVKYEKEVGDSVEKGETVLILEAMKMENALPAPVSGTIKAINFGSGDSVPKNAVLAVIG
jgi:oxaloacetate decarboxylase alpha subunit/pyruvate carboxylase subunit B